MSINVDFLFVNQQMQKLFQHQSANRISSSSTTPFAPPQPSISFQSSMHTFTPYAFPQPFPSFQTSMHFSSSPSAPYQTSIHFSSNPSAPYQYSIHSTATPFPPPQSSMHSSSPSAHQTPTGSSNPIAPPNLGISPTPRLRRKMIVTSETLNASKNASRYMGAIKFAGSQSSTHAPRRNE